jgi:dihydroorotate dehydrogenase
VSPELPEDIIDEIFTYLKDETYEYNQHLIIYDSEMNNTDNEKNIRNMVWKSLKNYFKTNNISIPNTYKYGSCYKYIEYIEDRFKTLYEDIKNDNNIQPDIKEAISSSKILFVYNKITKEVYII